MFDSRINTTKNVVIVMQGKYCRLPQIEAKNISHVTNKDDAKNIKTRCNLQIFGLSELRDSAKDMFDNISNTSLDISRITEQMTSTLASIQSIFKENDSLVGLGNKLCGIVLQMILTPKDRVIQTLASSIIGAFGFQIANFVYSVVGKHMFQLDNTTEILASLLMLAFQYALGLPKDFNPKTLLSFFADRGRNFKFALEGFNSMKMFIDNILVYVQEKLGIFNTDSELDQYCSGYNDWVDGIKSIILSHPDPLVKRLETSEELWFYIDELYKKALDYSRAFGEKRLPMSLNIEFQKMFKIIEDAKRQCDASGTFGNKPRIEPLVVHLFGESGVGKSGMAWPLSVDLNALFCSSADEAEEFAKNIYFRNTEQEFWDGYAGQNVVCYDDFGQRVDGMANPNEEFMELIRCSNMAPYPLHMADIIDKRRTKFTSKVIVLTSNVLNQQVNSLTFPDAYRRRIDVCGQVSVKDEYAYQAYSKSFGEMRMRLDPTKTDSVIDTKVYEVTLYDAESETPILDKDDNPIVLDYEAFVQRCIKASRVKIQRGTEINKVLSARMTPKRFSALKAQLQISMAEITKRISDGTIEVYHDCVETVRNLGEYLDKDTLFKFVSERRVWLAGIAASLGFLALIWSKLWSNDDTCVRHKIKKQACKVCTEMNHSGDSLTNKRVIKTEMTHSGDSTTNKQRVLTEMTHSGDALTSKRKYVVEMTKSGDDSTIRRKINMEHALNSSSDKVAADMQAWQDTVAQDLITTRILSNLYKIIRVGDNDTPLMNGLFVRDTVMLLPRHIKLGLNNEDTVRIENIYGSKFEIPVKDIKQLEINGRDNTYKDAILWQFPRHVNSHSDLVKHFQKMPELSAKRANICLPTIRSLKDELVVYIHGNTDASVETVELSTAHGDFIIRDSLRYKLNTTFGDCGSPVICNDKSVLRKICGIHIAGEVNGASAFAQSITQQDLISHLSLLDTVITDPDQMANIVVKSDLHLGVEFDKEISVSTLKKILNMAADTFFYLGKCSRVVFTPNKTELRKSIIHGKITPPTTKPAFLTSSKCNILQKNLEKCGMNTPYIPIEEINEAVASYKPLIMSNKNKSLCRVLTNEEAISGSSDSEFMNGISRGSSPGYPYIFNKESGKKGKTTWFGEDGEYVYSKEILERITHLENIAKQGKRIPFIWTDTLKDERRPIAKVDALKTRVFAAGPMDFTLLIRKYFLGFVANTMENRIDNEQSLGTNPFGSDWDRTARKLNSKGKKVFAGDFSTFDGTLNPGIMNAFVDIVNEWYDDGKDNALLRRTLFLDVMNSVHLCGDQFYGTTHSQPSGNPLTTILNSWYNSVSMRIAYSRAAKMAQIKPPQFNSVVSMVSYGDDNVINLSDSISDWFNQITVSEAYSTFGMTYTDEGKTGELITYKTLSEVAYLKRGFRYADGHCFAPLELGVCLEMCNWIRNSPDPIEQCEANIASAARELTQHGEQVFNTWVPQLVRAFYEETNKYPVIGTYRFYIEELV